MNRNKHERGQSLIEVLFAIAIFVTGVITIGYLILDAHIGLRLNIEHTEARYLAIEGLEAVRGMRDDSWDNIQDGTHGLTQSAGVWMFSSTSDSIGKFVRTITVSAVDEQTKKIVSTVQWNGTDERQNQTSFVTYLGDSKQSAGEARYFRVNVTSAVLSASSTSLEGIALENTGAEAIVLEKMKVQWDTGALLERISISGADVFYSSTSSTHISSNSIVDITDVQILAGTTIPLDALSFTDEVMNTDFILTFIFSDETKKHSFVSF